MHVWTQICQWLFYSFYADQTLISKNIILKTSLFISKLCKNKLHHVPLTRLHINRSCFINTLTNVSLSLSFSLNLYNEACATQVHQASSNPTLYYPLQLWIITNTCISLHNSLKWRQSFWKIYFFFFFFYYYNFPL